MASATIEEEEDSPLNLDTMFPEPERPPTPDPTTSTYSRRILSKDSNSQAHHGVKIRLVGNHSLWAHYLWNAARSFASYLDTTRLSQGRTVLELGAGGALPSIIAALTGASKVVITDYPDPPLIDNICHNLSVNLPPEVQANTVVQGYVWGRDTKPLRAALPPESTGFDVIILSDLIFNHSQHTALLDTCERLISEDEAACVLVFYTHHRPHLAHRDMEFFVKARNSGWASKEIVTEIFPPMFPEDSGDEVVRSTVHGWKLTRP